jgi:pimeloyl-ACP methyl ester carboxylesterase
MTQIKQSDGGGAGNLPWHRLDFMRESILDRAGANLLIARCDSPIASDRPTIVFLHGVLRNWKTFYPLLNGLREHANLVGLDFRGHGGSDPTPDAYRVTDYVEDAVHLVDRLKGRVLLYGHSLGAMVALAAASRLAERVEMAVLEDPPFSTMGQRLEASPLMRYFQGVERTVQQEVAIAAAGLGSTDAAARVERLFESFSNLVVAERPDGVVVRVRDQRDVISRRFSAEALAKIDPEVLAPITSGRWMESYDLQTILLGVKAKVALLRADTSCGGMLTSDESRSIVDRLNGRCEEKYYPGVGHTIHWSKPREILQWIIPLLK